MICSWSGSSIYSSIYWRTSIWWEQGIFVSEQNVSPLFTGSIIMITRTLQSANSMFSSDCGVLIRYFRTYCLIIKSVHYCLRHKIEREAGCFQSVQCNALFVNRKKWSSMYGRSWSLSALSWPRVLSSRFLYLRINFEIVDCQSPTNVALTST